MQNVTLIGLDLGKHSFHVHGQDHQGKGLLRKKFSRKQLIEFFAHSPRGTTVDTRLRTKTDGSRAGRLALIVAPIERRDRVGTGVHPAKTHSLYGFAPFAISNARPARGWRSPGGTGREKK